MPNRMFCFLVNYPAAKKHGRILLLYEYSYNKRYSSSCRYNEQQLIDVTAVRRVRPRAERSCDCEGQRRWKRAGRTLFCNWSGRASAAGRAIFRQAKVCRVLALYRVSKLNIQEFRRPPWESLRVQNLRRVFFFAPNKPSYTNSKYFYQKCGGAVLKQKGETKTKTQHTYV